MYFCINVHIHIIIRKKSNIIILILAIVCSRFYGYIVDFILYIILYIWNCSAVLREIPNECLLVWLLHLFNISKLAGLIIFCHIINIT